MMVARHPGVTEEHHLVGLKWPTAGLDPGWTCANAASQGGAGGRGHPCPSLGVSRRGRVIFFSLSFFFNIYLFIWLRRVLVVARRLLSCSMQAP